MYENKTSFVYIPHNLVSTCNKTLWIKVERLTYLGRIRITNTVQRLAAVAPNYTSVKCDNADPFIFWHPLNKVPPSERCLPTKYARTVLCSLVSFLPCQGPYGNSLKMASMNIFLCSHFASLVLFDVFWLGSIKLSDRSTICSSRDI